MADIMSLIRILQEKDPSDPMNSLLRSRLSGQSMGATTSDINPSTVSPDIFKSRTSMLSNFGNRNDFIRDIVAEQEASTAQRKNQRLQDASNAALMKRMKSLIPKPVKVNPQKNKNKNNPLPPPVVPSVPSGPSNYIPPAPPTKPPKDTRVWLPEIKPEPKDQKERDSRKWDEYTEWACRTYGTCPKK